MFGKIENPKNEGLADLSVREFATFAPLIVLAVWIGLYPTPFLDRLETSVSRVMARVNANYPQNARSPQGAEPARAAIGPSAGRARQGGGD
jgi:NADH-quinone oxidoreductase subunit M